MKNQTSIVGDIKWRLYLIHSVFLFIGMILWGRIVYLGVAEKDFLQSKGKTSEKLEVIHAVRGSIIDRNGEVLSVSTQGYSISINPNFLKFIVF